MTREERLSPLRKEKSLPLDEGGKTLMEIVVILLGKGDQITLQFFIFLFVRRLARRLRERWRNSIVIFQLMESLDSLMLPVEPCACCMEQAIIF